MHQNERSLVQRYEGKPFAILGVNLDPNVQTLRQSAQQQHMTWRSFWDGGDLAIAREWKIQYLPAIYLIDQQGKIRYHPGEPPSLKALEQVIDGLLREGDEAKTASPAGGAS